MSTAQITILKHWGSSNSFTVITQGLDGVLCVAQELAYDEMLGCIARSLCPTMSDGSPQRYLGKPLFLTPPKQKPEPGEAHNLT